jgi:hypothetical protein
VTDERYRECERRWKESGAVEDEAVWFRERLRVGNLSSEHLDLAAYAGSDAARLVLGSEATLPLAVAYQHAERAERWGVPACACAGLALVEAFGAKLPADHEQLRGIVATWAQEPFDESAYPHDAATQLVSKGLDRFTAGDRCPVSIPPTGKDYDLSPYEPELSVWRARMADPKRGMIRWLAMLVTTQRQTGQFLGNLVRCAVELRDDEKAVRVVLDRALASWALRDPSPRDRKALDATPVRKKTEVVEVPDDPEEAYTAALDAYLGDDFQGALTIVDAVLAGDPDASLRPKLKRLRVRIDDRVARG